MIKRSVVACLLASQLVGWPSSAAPALSAEERKLNEDSFEYVWTTIRDKYWDAAIGGLDWKGVHDRLRPEIEKAHSMGEARKVLEKMLAELRLTHFEIIPQDAYSDIGEESAPAGNGVTGIDVRVVDRQALVTRIDDDSPAALEHVKPGWEIVRAGKTRLAPVIAKVEGAYEHSSLKGLVLRLAVASRLQGFPGDDLEVEFRAADGKPIIKKIRLAQPKGTLSKFGFLPASYVWIDSKKLAGDIEYIQFNMFLDPAHLMARFADAVKSCLNCRGFVLDLRGNPGGIGAMAMGMASWFVDGEGERLGTLYLRDSKLSFVISPRPTVFAGPLAILVDETSASTSEILAGGLKDLKRAHIFGTRTAAAALPSAIEMLPNGDGFQYAMANYVSQGGKPLEGIGVSPDVEAPLTREALLAGKDPALDAAVNWIQSAKEGTSQ